MGFRWLKWLVERYGLNDREHSRGARFVQADEYYSIRVRSTFEMEMMFRTSISRCNYTRFIRSVELWM